MTDEESSDLGAQAALALRVAIFKTTSISGINRFRWWGGFLSTLAAFCHADVGPEAHAILQGVNAAALKVLTTKGKQH